MLRDAEYFKTRIGGLDGAGDAGDYIVNVVKEKSIPRPIALLQEPATTNGKTSSDSKRSSDQREKKEEKPAEMVQEVEKA
jgi:vacuolar protein sorting-associated protein 54